MDIASGFAPAVLEARKGDKFIYWVDGSDIKGQIRDNKNTVLKATFTAITDVDEDTGIAVDESWKTGGLWQIGILFKKDDVITFKKSNNGFEFT